QTEDSKVISEGVLEVKGDFTQIACGVTPSFYACENHKVILSGEGQQIITMEESNSRFNELILINPIEDGNYIFVPEGRTFWNSLEIDLDYNQSKKIHQYWVTIEKKNDTVAIGDTIDIRMRGEENSKAEALVYYKCISKTGSADEKVITVPMKEYGPGKYQAYFKVTEDIDQIQKIQINLLDAEGNLYTKTLGKEKEGFPLEVGATVSIDLSGVSKLEKFAGMDLVLESKGLNEQARRKITGDTLYTITNLKPADDYRLAIESKNGFTAGTIENISISKGINDSIIVKLIEEPAKLTVIVTDDEGNIVESGYNLTFYDPARNFKQVGTGKELEHIFVGKEISVGLTLKEELGKKFKNPVEKYNVAIDKRESVLTLRLEKLKIITLTGIIVEDETGIPVQNANINVSQLLNNQFGNYIKLVTDNAGRFSIEVAMGKTTLGISHEQYMNLELKAFDESTEINGDSLDLGEIQLTPYKGRLTLELLKKPAHTSQEEPGLEQENLYNYTISIYNKTKQAKIKNFNIKPPYIFLNDTNIETGDVIEVTFTHKKDYTLPATIELTLDRLMNASGQAVAKENGKGMASIQSGNQRCELMVYNSDKKFIESCSMNREGKIISNPLKEGVYTFVFISSNNYLWRLNTLEQFEEIGLKEGIHFVKKEVEIKNGEIKDLGLIVVPELNEKELFFTDPDVASYAVVSENNRIGKDIVLRAKYSFRKPIESQTVKLLFRVPDQTFYVKDTLTIDGELVDSVNVSGSFIEVTTTKTEGVVRFNIRPTEAVVCYSNAYVEFKAEGRTVREPLGVVNEVVPYLTIGAPNVTSLEKVYVTGQTLPNLEVKIYDEGSLVGVTKANSTGAWNFQVSLGKDKSYSVHNLSARIEYNDQVIESETLEVIYKKSVPEIEKVTTIHSNQSLILYKNGEIVPKGVYTYVPSQSYTFIVDFVGDSAEEIENLCIVSNRNGEERKLDAKYDPQSKSWIATGSFGYNHVPGSFTVEYNLKKKRLIKEDGELNLEVLEQISTFADQFLYELKKENVMVGLLDENEIGFMLKEDTGGIAIVTIVIGDQPIEREKYEKMGYLFKEIDGKLGAVLLIKDETENKIFTSKVRLASNKTEDSVKSEDDDESSQKETPLVTKDERISMAATIIGELGNIAGSGKVVEAIDFISGIGTAVNTIAFTPANAVTDMGYVQKKLQESENISSEDKERLRDDLFLASGVYNFTVNANFIASLMDGHTRNGTMHKIIDIVIDKYDQYSLGDKLWEDIFGKNEDDRESGKSTKSGKGSSIKLPLQEQKTLVDPSGYVYETVPDNRITDATVTVYYKDENGEMILWNAEEFGQKNPLLTDENGFYAWDVPEGMWQVKVEKEGYETAYSEILPVPPVQTNVNIPLVSYEPPKVGHIYAYPEYIEIAFSKYVKHATLDSESIQLKQGENKVNIKIVYEDEEGNYSKKIKLIPAEKTSFEGKYTLNISKSITSYAGVAMQKAEIRDIEIVAEPKSIEILDKVEIELRKTVAIEIRVLPEEAAKGKKIIVTSGMEEIVSAEDVLLDERGRGKLKLKGNLPGTVDIDLRLEGSAVEKKIQATVKFPEDNGEIIEPPVVLNGDLNRNGIVNDEDYILLKNYLLRGNKLVIDLNVADVNKDGKVNSTDCLFLKKYILGLITI
ncbi:Dockerin type 1 protein, partial [Acetivibrio thermocellus YS]